MEWVIGECSLHFGTHKARQKQERKTHYYSLIVTDLRTSFPQLPRLSLGKGPSRYISRVENEHCQHSIK